MDLGPTQILCDHLKIFHLEDLQSHEAFPHKVTVMGCRGELVGLSFEGPPFSPLQYSANIPPPLTIHDLTLYFAQEKCRTGDPPCPQRMARPRVS